MNLNKWAERWNIPALALKELQQLYTHDTAAFVPSMQGVTTEAGMVNVIRLEASRKNCRLWRNNIGATYDIGGNFIRYGLANESATMNKVLKSADLIGIRPVIITPEMVGRTFGQFLSREVKAPTWKYSGTERELAQLNWINLINALGGDAKFASSEGTI